MIELAPYLDFNLECLFRGLIGRSRSSHWWYVFCKRVIHLLRILQSCLRGSPPFPGHILPNMTHLLIPTIWIVVLDQMAPLTSSSIFRSTTYGGLSKMQDHVSSTCIKYNATVRRILAFVRSAQTQTLQYLHDRRVITTNVGNTVMLYTPYFIQNVVTLLNKPQI